VQVTDRQLIEDVSDELFCDPEVDSDAIAVGAEGGAIRLRRAVGSLRQKRAAKKNAERVRGVNSVSNELEVLILDKHRREDADLRGDVLQALTLDVGVPAAVDAQVEEGVVWLGGSVDWQLAERAEAVAAARRASGVTPLDDRIRIEAIGSP